MRRHASLDICSPFQDAPGREARRSRQGRRGREGEGKTALPLLAIVFERPALLSVESEVVGLDIGRLKGDCCEDKVERTDRTPKR